MKFIRPTKTLDTGSLTRASTGTYFDAAGVMQTAGVNALRLTYDPANLAAGPRALVEGAATNILKYSNADTTTGWSIGSNMTRVGNTTAPDGTSTATVYTGSGAGNEYIAQQFVPFAANTTYTASGYVKLISGTTPAPGFILGADRDADGNAGTMERIILPFNTQPIDGTWRRFTLTFQNVAAYVGYIYLIADWGSGAQIAVWGAQLEVGSAATSYIPTTSAAVTRAADVVTGSGLLYTSIAETDYTAWNAATSYTVGTRVIRTVSGVHHNYENLVAGVSAVTPEVACLATTTPCWLDLGADNRWAMFDGLVGTATSATTTMTVVLAPGRFNSLALLQVDANRVTIDLSVSGSSVYSASMDLTAGNAVGNWYQFFYEPVYQQDALVVTDLVDASLMDIPAYSEGVLTVTLSKTAGTVSLGALIVGLYADLGDTQYQPTVGIIDYSRKDVDVFGNYTVVKRAYSKRMGAKVSVPKDAIDNVSRLLAQYRSTPLVWVGAGNLFTCMVIYGFYKDWELSIDNSKFGALSLTVEGLT